jgi:hypothetical protein
MKCCEHVRRIKRSSFSFDPMNGENKIVADNNTESKQPKNKQNKQKDISLSVFNTKATVH